MGQHADDILNGDVDEYTGEWLGDGQGFPRSMDPDHYSNKKLKKKSFKTSCEKLSGHLLIGKNVEIQIKGTTIGPCVVTIFNSNASNKKYTVIDKRDDKEYKVKFSQIKLIK